MKKRIVLGIVAALAVSTSIACASPIEMEQGKWNANVGVMFSPDLDLENNYGYGTKDSGDTSIYGGVTYGITDKWGVQVDYSHYKTGDAFETDKLDATEFNVLYKLNDNVNVFAGYVYAGMNATVEGYDFGGMHTDGFQAGLTGWYPLGDKFKTFGKVGLGNNSRVYEIGFSYAIADDWDVDLSYRNAEYKDLGDAMEWDFEYDGVRLGVSTSF